jgi:hypothetical protein
MKLPEGYHIIKGIDPLGGAYRMLLGGERSFYSSTNSALVIILLPAVLTG